MLFNILLLLTIGFCFIKESELKECNSSLTLLHITLYSLLFIFTTGAAFQVLSISPVFSAYIFYPITLFNTFKFLRLAKRGHFFKHGLHKTSSLFLILIILVSAFDTYSNYSWDSSVHIANITYRLENSFSPIDPFFQESIESRYTYNTIYYIQIFLAALTGESPLETWPKQYFISTIIFLVILFYSSRKVFGKNLKLTYALLLFNIFFYQLAGDLESPSKLSYIFVFGTMISLYNFKKEDFRTLKLLILTGTSIHSGFILGGGLTLIFHQVSTYLLGNERNKRLKGCNFLFLIFIMSLPILYFETFNNYNQDLFSHFNSPKDLTKLQKISFKLFTFDQNIFSFETILLTGSIFLTLRHKKQTTAFTLLFYLLLSGFLKYSFLTHSYLVSVIPYWKLNRLIIISNKIQDFTIFFLSIYLLKTGVNIIYRHSLQGKTKDLILPIATLVILVTFPNYVLMNKMKQVEAKELVREGRNIRAQINKEPSKEKSIILADPVVSNFAGSMTGLPVAGIYYGNAAFTVPIKEKNIKLQNILNCKLAPRKVFPRKENLYSVRFKGPRSIIRLRRAPKNLDCPNYKKTTLWRGKFFELEKLQ